MQIARMRIAALGAMLVSSLAGVTAVQAQQTPDSSARARADAVERHENARGARGARGARRAEGRKVGLVFRGIELTDDQKARVRSIHQEYRERFAELRTEARKSRGDGARPDSASRHALRERAMQVRAEERSAIRAVLTPEQQSVFDRNIEALGDRREQHRLKKAKRPATDRS
ncbi:MAG: Spy/CpxP family protein refolding chaperone [Gemmatimonadaceae bacterium]